MTQILKHSDAHGQQRFVYGRRQGPKPKPLHKRLLAELLPQLQLTLDDQFDPAKDEFFRQKPLWLEIGFGGGEHLAAAAAANPDCSIIGVEPYVTGVAKLLAAIEEGGLENLRILVDDARLLLKRLPDASLERVFILYPDPWPKARHNKRRIINDDTVADLARLMKPGSELRIATDHADYRLWILDVMRRAHDFEWLARRPKDWRERPSDQVQTRYERKALKEGRTPVYLTYRRRI